MSFWVLVALAGSVWTRQDGSIDWLVGDGGAFCSGAQHVTVACYTVVRQGLPDVTFCSDKIYMNTRADEVKGMITYNDRPCQGTRERQRDWITGPSALPQTGHPRPHSEIAALQDLFRIPGGRSGDDWARRIVRILRGHLRVGLNVTGLRQFHVWLYNSRHPPCYDGMVPGAHDPRCPCSDFLSYVAQKVNEAGFEFAIHVQWPDRRSQLPRRVVYAGLPASPVGERIVRKTGHIEKENTGTLHPHSNAPYVEPRHDRGKQRVEDHSLQYHPAENGRANLAFWWMMLLGLW